MPSHAFLRCDELVCPYCSHRLLPERINQPAFIKFQWGYLPSRFPEQPKSLIYAVGDKIRWRPSKDGQVRAWSSFADDWSMNAGDPHIEHLIVTETGSDIAYFPYTCDHCKQVNGGGALEIINDLIVRAWAFKPDELIRGTAPSYREWRADLGKWIPVNPKDAYPDQIVTIYIVNPDGSITPKPEWEDMPLTTE